MTELKPGMDVLKTKLDLAREDIRRLHPLLSLLEPQDRDQLSGFAERLIQLMRDVEESYREQTREFASLKNKLDAIDAKLEFLVGDE